MKALWILAFCAAVTSAFGLALVECFPAEATAPLPIKQAQWHCIDTAPISWCIREGRH